LAAATDLEEVAVAKFLDANGVVLQSGDTVRVVKDLKVGSNTIKSGTKVKSIRLLDDPVDGHDISCKIDGFGSVYLKCSVVRKDS
jgi:protein PhnA